MGAQRVVRGAQETGKFTYPFRMQLVKLRCYKLVSGETTRPWVSPPARVKAVNGAMFGTVFTTVFSIAIGIVVNLLVGVVSNAYGMRIELVIPRSAVVNCMVVCGKKSFGSCAFGLCFVDSKVII